MVYVSVATKLFARRPISSWSPASTCLPGPGLIPRRRPPHLPRCIPERFRGHVPAFRWPEHAHAPFEYFDREGYACVSILYEGSTPQADFDDDDFHPTRLELHPTTGFQRPRRADAEATAQITERNQRLRRHILSVPEFDYPADHVDAELVSPRSASDVWTCVPGGRWGLAPSEVSRGRSPSIHLRSGARRNCLDHRADSWQSQDKHAYTHAPGTGQGAGPNFGVLDYSGRQVRASSRPEAVGHPKGPAMKCSICEKPQVERSRKLWPAARRSGRWPAVSASSVHPGAPPVPRGLVGMSAKDLAPRIAKLLRSTNASERAEGQFRAARSGPEPRRGPGSGPSDRRGPQRV
jgi:hypothetical protein